MYSFRHISTTATYKKVSNDLGENSAKYIANLRVSNGVICIQRMFKVSIIMNGLQR